METEPSRVKKDRVAPSPDCSEVYTNRSNAVEERWFAVKYSCDYMFIRSFGLQQSVINAIELNGLDNKSRLSEKILSLTRIRRCLW